MTLPSANESSPGYPAQRYVDDVVFDEAAVDENELDHDAALASKLDGPCEQREVFGVERIEIHFRFAVERGSRSGAQIRLDRRPACTDRKATVVAPQTQIVSSARREPIDDLSICRVEISAESGDGFPDDKIRVVLENARTLGATRTLLGSQADEIAAVQADIVVESSGSYRGLASAVRGAVRGGRVASVQR